MKALEGHYFGRYRSPFPPTISPQSGDNEQDPDDLPCRVEHKRGSKGKRLSHNPLSGTYFHTVPPAHPLLTTDMGDSGNQGNEQIYSHK